jgi:hypothetical protein
MTKRMLLYFAISISSLSLSIYAADNKIDVKQEIAQLKSQIQNLEMHLASADQAITSSTAATTIDTSVSSPKNKKNSNHEKITQHNKKDVPATSAVNKNSSTATQNISLTNNKSANSEPTTTLSPANLIPPYSWQGTDIAGLMVGGASAGFTKPSGNSGSFNILDFNPIFLFSYKELMFLRAAVDFSLDDHGNTNVSLNYTNLNLFLGDYAVLGAGKFDTALGYFVQNLSPAWINRMPDAPVGFNADQAAPQNEVGVRLQGAFPLFTTMKANYALFMSNGDQAFVDTTNLVIDHIGSDGYTNNFGNYFYGGRLGFLPIPKLEIGISGASGKLALFNLADGTTLLKRSRAYSAVGADISFKPGNWDLRAEFIQQLISSKSGSIVPQGQKWKAWYAQVAYWIPTTKWEPVVRYSKFTAPVASQEQRQWAFGLDYWFAPSIAAQASFELNKGQSGSDTNQNLFLIQLVFGF